MAPAFVLLVAGLALADPEIEVSYHSGIPQIALIGDFSMSRYTIVRAAEPAGPFVAISQHEVLCLGSCFVDDATALPGRTYWYRFDIRPANGSPASFGPYSVTIRAPYATAAHARVFPNPSRGSASVELYLFGAPADLPLDCRATVLDLQGRRVRTLVDGPLRRGITMLSWDGRDDRGRALEAGSYFVRFATPLGTTIHRIVRAR
jgi:hypothetical protein